MPGISRHGDDRLDLFKFLEFLFVREGRGLEILMIGGAEDERGVTACL